MPSASRYDAAQIVDGRTLMGVRMRRDDQDVSAVDPLGAAIAAAGVVRESVAWVRAQNELRSFLEELEKGIESAPEVAHSAKLELRRQMGMLRVEPEFLSAVVTYLQLGDQESALARMAPVFDRVIENTGIDADVERPDFIREVHRAATRAWRSDRDAMSGVAERLEASMGSFRELARPVYVSADFGPEWTRKALTRLGKERPHELQDLQLVVGDGHDLRTIEDCILRPPDSLRRASGWTWVALARFAEAHGQWSLARTAWHRVVENPTPSGPAEAWVRAAIAAHAAGDAAGRAADLHEARKVDETHPRLRLEQLHDIEGTRQRLAALADIHSDDPEIQALIWCHEGVEHLMLENVDRAEQLAAKAALAAPDIAQHKILAANATIHRARLAVPRHAPVDAVALVAARGSLLELRQSFLDQRRYEEASRALMLAVDASVLAGDRAAVDRLLDDAELEELTCDGEALAQAAVRAHRPAWALATLEAHVQSTEPWPRLIRAHAFSLTDDPDDLRTSLAELEELAQLGRPPATDAALLRVTRCAVDGDVAWHEPSEAVLLGTPQRPDAIRAKALWLALQGEKASALKLLQEHADEPWIHSAMLDVAVYIDDEKLAAASAAEALSHGVPDPWTRFQFCVAMMRGGDVQRAWADLRALVGDARTPADVRANAYAYMAEVSSDIADVIEFTTELRRLDSSHQRLPLLDEYIASRIRA